MTARTRRLWTLVAPAAFLVIAATRPQTSRTYDLQLGFVGYTGLAESGNCRLMVDTLGYDSLIGTVSGRETDEPDEDVVYTGTLRRRTKIDYCQTRPARGSDQVGWCVATLTATARMDVEVTVYGEEGRGAWIKAKPAQPRTDTSRVVGSCLQPDMDSIRVDYPSGASAGSPDGQPIEETAPPRFIVNGIPRLRTGYFPADTVQRGWGLRVVRAAP